MRYALSGCKCDECGAEMPGNVREYNKDDFDNSAREWYFTAGRYTVVVRSLKDVEVDQAIRETGKPYLLHLKDICPACLSSMLKDVLPAKTNVTWDRQDFDAGRKGG